MAARPRILMVDDHPANLLALEAILGPLGCPMVRAQSADEAFRQLIDGDFAVILMDVQMPGTDGFAAATLIKQREKTRGIPIIFITALSRDPSFVFQGYEHGAVDYILKPFEPTILRSKVAVFIELFEQREQIAEQGKRLLEADRARADRRYRALCDCIPVSLWVTDQAGKVGYCNQRMLDTCGISQEELARSGWVACVHTEDRARVVGAWERAIRSKQRVEVEFRMHCGSEVRWQLGCIAPEYSDEQHPAWVVTATDIDAQKSAQRQAERANVLKDEFLATVSHELRTPLNAMLGWSQTLLDESLDADRTRLALEAIARNARAQAELVADVLDVSRIVTGKLSVEQAKISLSPAVHGALDVVRSAADAKSIALTATLHDEDCLVLGDTGRLKQVLWNLLSNAIKFTPKGGNVRIAMRNIDGDMNITIEDDGAGIAPEFLPFVFDRFRQADSSSTRAYGGLGLGLAIVKQLVELHGGRVAVTSDGLGRGARFDVSLPICGRGPITAAFPQVVVPKATSWISGRRVLLVDDDADSRELLEIVFARKGAIVQSAGSVAAAFERIGEAVPDIIVSDIGMPGEDGYSFMRRVRGLTQELGGRVPSIALTGFARDDDAERVREAGFHAHMAKPVEPKNLLALVEQLLAPT